ncbi:MAG: AAA family ATPase [Steroidobacteraceae bacterium]
MYLTFYGLAEKPFAITPDPRYLFLGGQHAEALAHLVYGITEAGGFIQLTGEVGTGKTTIIRSLLSKQPENAEIALILNPRMNATEFLLTICEELGILVPDDAIGSVKELVDILNRYLLRAHASGRRVVLVVDEAQNLPPELLEQVRLLTNLETETQKLLQIILIGQPELREVLARNDLRQLAQRITGRYHLEPLTQKESAAYVKHRLRIAGATSDLFTPGALRELHRASGGVPRLLNIIGDRALLGGYSEDRHQVSASMVRKAAGEVFDRRLFARWLPWALGAGTVFVVAGALLTGWALYARTQRAAPAPAITAPRSAAPAAAQETAPPAAPVPAASADLGSLLAAPHADDIDGAWQQLFARWSARYVAGTEEACAQALRQGLECLPQRGGLERLRLFNRPAILPLDRAVGGPLHAVLTAVDTDRVQLLLGNDAREFPLPQLLQHWGGDFVLLWKPPQLDTRNLSMGMRGEPVRQLRERLRRWAGLSVDGPGSDFFDASLETLVQQFQRQHDLAVDGIAGSQTQALLDGVLAQAGTPQLTPVAGT